MKIKNGRAWTDAENSKLLECVDQGLSKFRIASIFNRTTGAVSNQARKLGRPIVSINEQRRELKQKLERTSSAADGPAR
jgi:glycerol uptake facilitator-like aquaporin